MSKTIRQHYLPAFVLKKWKINESKKISKIRYYDMTTKRFKKTVIRSKNDPFSKNNYYEHDSKEENEIEDGLAKLEYSFNKVQTKIESQVTIERKITINRKELFLIKLFALVQSTRSLSLETAHLANDGDSLFRAINYSKTPKEIKELQIRHLAELLDLFNDLSKRKSWSEIIKKITSSFRNVNLMNFAEGRLSIDLINEINSYVFYYLCSTYLNWILLKEEQYRFILTDAGPIQAVAPITGIPLFEIMPILPKIAICFVNVAFVIEPFLCKEQKEIFEETFGKSEIFDRKIENEYQDKTLSKCTWEDTFTYTPINITNYQISILNAQRISQARNYVVCIEEEDAIEALKWHIPRIEDIN